jgi:hypothetical protein
MQTDYKKWLKVIIYARIVKKTLLSASFVKNKENILASNRDHAVKNQLEKNQAELMPHHLTKIPLLQKMELVYRMNRMLTKMVN